MSSNPNNQCHHCHNIPNIKINLSCGHTYCYSCILQLQKCTNCNPNTVICFDEIKTCVQDFYMDDDIIWLYSSRYNNFWWCFDTNTNQLIESAFQDYSLRNTVKNFNENKNVQDIDIHETKSISYNNITPIHPSVGTFKTVNFSTKKNNISKKNMRSKYILYEYCLFKNEFVLDFDSMKQINKKTNSKRDIKRIILDQDIDNSQKWEYIKNNYNVIGVAGIEFNCISMYNSRNVQK